MAKSSSLPRSIPKHKLNLEKLGKSLKLPVGPIISPSPGPTFDIAEADPDIAVTKSKPSIELTTADEKDGVVFARCRTTHDILKLVDGELWSEELRERVPRKISSMYGKVQV